MIPTRIFFQIHDSQRLLMNATLVSCCIVFFCCPHVCFHPVLCRFFDHCFSVSSFVLFRYGFFCNSTLSSSVTGETSGLSAPNARGAYCPRKKFENWTLGNAILCISWIKRNEFSYVYFVALFSESRYSWFPSRSTKIHYFQVFKNRDS